MGRKNKQLDFLGRTTDFAKGGVILGVGGSVLGGIGGTTSNIAGRGLTSFGRMMRPMGTAIGAGFVLKSLSYMQPPKQKRFRF